MLRRIYHVLPVQDGGWKVKEGGALKASKTFEGKAEAINFGKTLSVQEKAQLIIHRKDGTIQNADSYVKNPDAAQDQ